MIKSQTLLKPFVVEGIGLHTGAEARVEIHPATAPRGRIFHREGIEIPALVDFVTDTRRCTTLGHQGRTVSTVEHLLAALLLAGIDHAEIYVDGPEIPALDGSAQQWYQAIREAGLSTLEEESTLIRITDARWVIDGDSQFFLLPAETLTVYAALSIPETVVDHVVAGGSVADSAICEQLVRARTYGLEREVQALLDAGLARGGSLDNAVILTRTGYLNAHVWPAEPAWHKALDLVGDLALTGTRLAGHVLAVRGGHRSQVAVARYLRTLLA